MGAFILLEKSLGMIDPSNEEEKVLQPPTSAAPSASFLSLSAGGNVAGAATAAACGGESGGRAGHVWLQDSKSDFWGEKQDIILSYYGYM